MENKSKLLFIWVAIGLLVAGLVWVAVWGNKTTVIVNDKGQVVGAVSGPELPNPSCINGLCTYVGSADFKNSTTTLISFSMVDNNIPATATVDFLQLTNTGVATSSYALYCGNAKSGGGKPDINWLRTITISTTTLFGTVFNNSTSTGGWIGSSGVGGAAGDINMATTSPRLTLNPKDFFICTARGINGEDPLGNSGGYDSAFTNNGEVFGGRFKIRLNYSTY